MGHIAAVAPHDAAADGQAKAVSPRAAFGLRLSGVGAGEKPCKDFRGVNDRLKIEPGQCRRFWEHRSSIGQQRFADHFQPVAEDTDLSQSVPQIGGMLLVVEGHFGLEQNAVNRAEDFMGKLVSNRDSFSRT